MSEPFTTSPTPLRDPKSVTPPFWIVGVAMVLIVVTFIPLVVAARGRFERTRQPRIHIFQDMDKQPRYEPQDASDVFADNRAMRLPVVGTVARGKLRDDPKLYNGYTATWNEAENRWDVSFVEDFPEQIQLTENLLQRGQLQFTIHCLPCHGADGMGNGPVNRRAVQLQASGVTGTWVEAANLHDQTIRNRPVGHLYNTIVKGIRTMPPYGDRIPDVEDRWAVVAYIRALQLSQNAPKDMLPESVRAQASE